MKLRKSRLIAVLFAVGVQVVPTFAASQRDPGTVGDLLMGIASAKSLQTTNATTAEAALRASGYDLPQLDRSKVLTEGDVAAIANAVGLPVVSSNPARSFSRLQVDRFLTTMNSELTSIRGRLRKDDAGTTNKDDNSGSGNGKKPRSKSPKAR